MMTRVKHEVKRSRAPLYLGIEAGGTRTVALLAGADAQRVCRLEAGPANLRLLDDRQLARHLRSMAKSFPRPTAVAIGLAGARTEADRARISQAAAKVWPGVPCYPTNDLETALMAADEKSLGKGAVRPRAARASPDASPRAPHAPNAPPGMPHALPRV